MISLPIFPLLLQNLSFIFDILRMIFTLFFLDFIIAPSTSSSFFSFSLSIFSRRFSSYSFSLFSRNCCKASRRFLLISSISFSFWFHSLFSCSFVNLFLNIKQASSDKGGNASLKALFSLAFAISSISYISTGRPFPYEKSPSSKIS